VPGTLDGTAGQSDDDFAGEVPAAFGLSGREDCLRVVNDVLVSGGSVAAADDTGAGKSSL